MSPEDSQLLMHQVAWLVKHVPALLQADAMGQYIQQQVAAEFPDAEGVADTPMDWVLYLLGQYRESVGARDRAEDACQRIRAQIMEQFPTASQVGETAVGAVLFLLTQYLDAKTSRDLCDQRRENALESFTRLAESTQQEISALRTQIREMQEHLETVEQDREVLARRLRVNGLSDAVKGR